MPTPSKREVDDLVSRAKYEIQRMGHIGPVTVAKINVACKKYQRATSRENFLKKFKGITFGYCQELDHWYPEGGDYTLISDKVYLRIDDVEYRLESYKYYGFSSYHTLSFYDVDSNYIEWHVYYTKNHPHYLLHGFAQSVPLSIIVQFFDYCEQHNRWYDTRQDSHCPICTAETRKLILDYSTKAERTLPSLDNPSTTIQYGIELELEGVDAKGINVVSDATKEHCILKRDGSLSNGVEIVTRPATIEQHRAYLDDLFTVLPTTKLHAQSNCGMHVHVSREPLTPLQINKMMKFMELNKVFVERIAGRADNSYAIIKDLTSKASTEYSATTRVPYRKRIKYTTTQRYSAINCKNANTIEFRVFASTNEKEVFYKNLEFVKAVVDITTPGFLNLSAKESITEEMFTSYVLRNRKDYPNLAVFLKGTN